MSAEQTKQLEQVLRPVAARLASAASRPRLVRALFLGAAMALVPALLRLFTGSLIWGGIAFLALAGYPLYVLVRSLAQRADVRRAALAVDLHYAWQDRVSTAWSVLSVGGMTPLEQFQAADALRRAPQVVPAAVVPLSLPRGIPRAVGLALAVLCALLWPIDYHRGEPTLPSGTQLARPAEVAAKPLAAVVPEVSPAIAVASLGTNRADGSPASTFPAPTPDQRLIHDYFEAVCPLGR